MKPFRWNLHKKEQLGRLTQGERSEAYPNFVEDLRTCCCRLLAFSDDSILTFVGRSPESFFDYLSGIFEGSEKLEDLVHLNLSNRGWPVSQIEVGYPGATAALKEHFADCGVTPADIIHRKRKTLFTDLVYTGGTFGEIATFLFEWAEADKVELKALSRKLGFLGVTWRERPRPKIERWWQHVSWIETYRLAPNICSVSAPGALWDYLGNRQSKLTPPNRPENWPTDTMLAPSREEDNLKALRRAYDLFCRGQGERKAFAERLSRERAMDQAWFRSLVAGLREKASR